jgi:hypothetical protein
MAPGLGTAKNIELDDYDWMITRLLGADLLKPIQFLDKNKQAESERHAIEWTENDQNMSNLISVVNSLHSSDENFSLWMDWVLHNALKEHSIRFSGLFDPFFLPAVSKVLGVSLDESKDLLSLSKKYDEVKAFAQSGRAEFTLISKGYIASAMLRGIVNDKSAELYAIQIKHHPFRELILPEPSKLSESFLPSNTAYFLTEEIIRGALSQKSLREKINIYIDNVRKARSYANTESRLFDEDKTAHEAKKLAREIAHKADLTIGSKKTELYFTVGIGLSAGVVVNLYFTSFVPNIMVGFLASFVADKLGISHKAASYYHRAGRYFDELPSGRIQFRKSLRK